MLPSFYKLYVNKKMKAFFNGHQIYFKHYNVLHQRCLFLLCRLITAERASYEKYLGEQWFNFCRERVMEEGGKLIFDLKKLVKNLHVRVVPK